MNQLEQTIVSHAKHEAGCVLAYYEAKRTGTAELGDYSQSLRHHYALNALIKLALVSESRMSAKCVGELLDIAARVAAAAP